MLNDYYRLAKPGIIYGNIITTIGGFFLASRGHINLGLLLATVVGTSLVIGSACVFNNYIDRGIDARMKRTQRRPLVSEVISVRNALIYGTILCVLGFLVLGEFTNWLVVGLGFIAFVFYVVFYGLAKRKSVHGTLVGTIPGAAPVVAGYVAVTDHFDAGALILFLILVVWQMPHFYSIAMYRFDDYSAAGLPVMPVKKGMMATKFQIIAYTIVFIPALLALTVYGYAGYSYLFVMELFALVWLTLAVRGLHVKDDKQWARKMFFVSLSIILALSIMLAVGSVLP
jgi:protoheme IX farnesyltransferase